MISISEEKKRFFEEKGYLVLENLLSPEEIKYYQKVYDAFLNNEIDSGDFRSDLSGSEVQAVEKITQIMVPGRLHPELLAKPAHQRTLEVARLLLGEDMALDFDMLINKAPHTNAPTPWHQDAAYWIDLPDKRAVSCWIAIDKATKENGCMWYVPGSHLGAIKPHVQTGNKGALKCDGSEADGDCIELEPGSCVIHQGKTLHYSRGNTTSLHRRALITNYRPEAMIALERSKGVDHTGLRKVNTES
ncbi:phytanoyl-CoA dioxygenase family protein [Poritiphilus flavus]|uniref:Phytanoyl-CoA dioxygenase family protein n=1 Tax=Poritiphilus flavus TaxID=2697053 RepID=A0A6L9E9X7_9FLAO|nr:phytanoyl-CoA dioxygenase family protein [Poritiphilus flavus]NAS11289.1 phytanoyl-CoA dioxygenase family protein [Poritiphilus flavus]